jgi:hypothetical protein
VARGDDAPADPADPAAAAVLADLGPYAAAVCAVALLGTPAEVVVPIVRRLRGRTGVSAGPGLVDLAHGVVALGITHRLRRHPARWERWRHADVPRWARVAAVAHLTLAPAAAAGWRRGVVLRGRSPLWGGVLSPVGLLQVGLAGVAVARLRGLRSEQAGAGTGPRRSGSGGQSS